MTGGIFSFTDTPEDTDRKLVSKISGSWMGCVLFDEKRYWSIKDKLPKFALVPSEDPLPSDSRFREDILNLRSGDIDVAADWKSKLEEKQRSEAKIRKAYCQENALEYVAV